MAVRSSKEVEAFAQWRDVATRDTIAAIAGAIAHVGEPRTREADVAFVTRVMRGTTTGNRERVQAVRQELDRRGLRPTPAKGPWAILLHAEEGRWTADVADELKKHGPFTIIPIEGPVTERDFHSRRDDFAGFVAAPGTDVLRLDGMWPTPVVLFDCRPDERTDVDNVVEVDQFEAGRLATLRCLDLGCKKVVMMCRSGATGRDRRDGYLSALADWGMLGTARIVIAESASARVMDQFPIPQEPGRIERVVHPTGVKAASRQAAIQLAGECDGIISANSSLTVGVRAALAEMDGPRPHHVGFTSPGSAVAGEDEIMQPVAQVAEIILAHIRAIRSGRRSPNSLPVAPMIATTLGGS